MEDNFLVETLKYVFSSPWVFIGCLLLINCCAEALCSVISRLKDRG